MYTTIEENSASTFAKLAPVILYTLCWVNDPKEDKQFLHNYYCTSEKVIYFVDNIAGHNFEGRKCRLSYFSGL